MQNFDITNEEFSIEALEARFEMEVVGVPPSESPDWKCTCTIEN